MASLFSDFLSALGVPHTESYSDARFRQMPFQSMFGLKNLLRDYGIGAIGLRTAPDSRQSVLAQLPVPFLADTDDGFAIVLKVEADAVVYMSQHRTFKVAASRFAAGWNGIALLASADSTSVEPDYKSHRMARLIATLKYRLLQVLVVALVAFAMWQSGLYARWQAWMVVALDCGGIMLSWMLVQKSLGIHTQAAQAVCSILEEGGCDRIAQSQASSFLGIFKWSEVGLAYFAVSLLAMLMFPHTLPVLAAINILALPYTIWSISYQKFKAKVWCTLCVSVQLTLWLLFAAYLLGGWTWDILPLTADFCIRFVIIGACMVAALLALNRLDNALPKYFRNEPDAHNDNA